MAAIVGVQLVISMVMASLLSKLSTHMSFGRWLLVNRLVRYLHPTDDELRTLARIPIDKGKGRNKYVNKNDAFTVPKNLDIQLDSAPIGPKDVLPLKFYLEFQWLMDFAFTGTLIYFITEFYYSVMNPDNEFNLSMLWCLLVMGFSVKILFSLTVIYFRTEEGGERILIFIFSLIFLIFAMGVMITNEESLELGLEPGYINFTTGARRFLQKQGVGSAGPATFTTLKIILTIVATILGTFLTFPGLRLAKMYSDALKYTENPLMNLCLSINIVTPLFLSLMWVRPVMRDFLVKRDVHGHFMLLSDEKFDAIRIYAILGFCFFRFLLMWTHLQAHLNMAVEKIEALKKEAGRISTIELQQLITRVFYYLCVVALQYMAPLVLLLYSTFMLKTLGETDLLSPFGIVLPTIRNNTATPVQPIVLGAGMGETIAGTAAQFSIALAALRQVFTPLFFRGIFSFISWWICVSWFISSSFGMIYYQYFSVA